MDKNRNFIISDRMPWEPAGEGMERQALGHDGRLMLVAVRFAAGSVGAEHTHPHSQSTYVSAGRFSVTIGGVARILGAGDGYYVEPHAPHGVTCLEAGTLIDAFSPAREDFLA